MKFQDGKHSKLHQSSGASKWTSVVILNFTFLNMFSTLFELCDETWTVNVTNFSPHYSKHQRECTIFSDSFAYRIQIQKAQICIPFHVLRSISHCVLHKLYNSLHGGMVRRVINSQFENSK